jgi:hypothetical protein
VTMRIRLRQVVLLLLILFVVIFVFASFRPHANLVLLMPAAFGQNRAPWSPTGHHTAQELANGYWNASVALSSSQFQQGQSLPVLPPTTFTVNPQFYGEDSNSDRVRNFYWAQLQQIWPNQAYWEHRWVWNTEWLSGLVKRWGRWLDDEGHNFIKTGPLS